jgi:hypothetical protein
MDEILSVQTQQGRTCQVDLLNYPRWIQGKVADRGEIIQMSILPPCGQQFILGPAHFLILQFQLNLMDLKFVEHFLNGVRR